MQGEHVLGEIDAEEDNGGRGHRLAAVGSGLRSSNPLVDPARCQRMRINVGWLAGLRVDVPFIRWSPFSHSVMHLRLFDWAPSPFCMKIRTLLRYKGVRYERVAVLGPSLIELIRRSNIRKVPALDVDGQLLIDSTDIAHEIERLFPEPATVPLDPGLRGLSHVLEDWSDEALYFLGLYFQWIDRRGKPMVVKAFGAGPLGVAARLFYQRRIAAQLRGQGTGRKALDHIVADLHREFTALVAMLEGKQFILGDKPYLCDFAINAQLVYMSRPPGSAEVLRQYAALGAYMERMKALRPTTAPHDVSALLQGHPREVSKTSPGGIP